MENTMTTLYNKQQYSYAKSLIDNDWKFGYSELWNHLKTKFKHDYTFELTFEYINSYYHKTANSIQSDIVSEYVKHLVKTTPIDLQTNDEYCTYDYQTYINMSYKIINEFPHYVSSLTHKLDYHFFKIHNIYHETYNPTGVPKKI